MLRSENQAGPVQQAIRRRVAVGERLLTPTKRAAFTVSCIDERGVVLLFGEQETPTRFSWECLEGVVPLLAGRGWIPIAGTYDVRGQEGTLDGYLKAYIKRATAGWVAALLERAGVVEVDRTLPSHVRLSSAVGAVSAANLSPG